MKKSLAVKKLISAIMATIMLLYFMEKSPSPKIIFIPFLIGGVSMVGKSIAQILEKKKLEFAFGKIFVFGFLLFFMGFLTFAGYISIRDKNYILLVHMIPFCIAGIFLIKNSLFSKKREKNVESFFTFAVAMSTILVVIAFLAGIFLFILGIKDANVGLLLGGVMFTFGSFTFVLAALTLKGCFDKASMDVLGLYAGAVTAVVGIGFFILMCKELLNSHGLWIWISIPILMIVVGIYQVIKCIRNKTNGENGEN